MGVRKPGYDPKRRNAYNRQSKKVIIIAAEGNNKTETLYFKNFNSDKIRIYFARGNATDPVKLMNDLDGECQERDINVWEGDAAFCLVDSDFDAKKDKQLKEADTIAREKGFNMIVSSPCFEEWFLCHFMYSTRQFNSKDEILAAVDKKLPGYSKASDKTYDRLIDKQKIAVENARKLEKYNLDNGKKLHTVAFSPSTEVYKVLEKIKEISEK